jgi:hypothetical protein
MHNIFEQKQPTTSSGKSGPQFSLAQKNSNVGSGNTGNSGKSNNTF